MTAAAMTYTSLVSDVISYTERTDTTFADQIPRFIMLAEDWLSREVRGLGVWKVTTGALVAGDASLAKPNRWRETGYFKMLISGGTPKFLKKRSLTYCQQFWPDADATGVPTFYAEYDYDHFLISATPDLAYSIELAYYEKPEPLSDENNTNWLTDNAPATLLYATLAEAQIFLKNMDKVNDLRSTSLAAVGLISQEQAARTSDNAGDKS